MLEMLKRNLNEFKEFAVKGNVIDMAVGIIIGAAFGNVVNSVVNDVIMPPLGFLMGKVDFSNMYLTLYNPNPDATYSSLQAAADAGVVTINYGLFINTLISFAMVAFAVFLLVKAINKLKAATAKKEADDAAAADALDTKECPRCFSKIDIKATKCPHCTADI
jgi:large conductance mechanosensitive channel